MNWLLSEFLSTFIDSIMNIYIIYTSNSRWVLKTSKLFWSSETYIKSNQQYLASQESKMKGLFYQELTGLYIGIFNIPLLYTLFLFRSFHFY